MIRCANIREINFCPIEGEIAYDADTGRIFVYHNQQYIELPTKADTTEASNKTLDISKPLLCKCCGAPLRAGQTQCDYCGVSYNKIISGAPSVDRDGWIIQGGIGNSVLCKW